MGGRPGITGVDHVAVLTPDIEAAEEHYEKLFGARVLFRGATHEGEDVLIDRRHGWDEIRRLKLRVEWSFLRAGGLTIGVIGRRAGREGPVDHVGIGCTEPELRRIRERVRGMKLRVYPDTLGTFKFRDQFGVLWEVSRGMGVAAPTRRLDLGTGRVIGGGQT